MARLWQSLLRPKSFLGLTTLQNGTQIIACITLFNKLTAVYGLLGILTGYSLSALQLVAFLYTTIAAVLLLVCTPRISKQAPLSNLALAWIYALDTILSAAITAAFAGLWIEEVPAPEESATAVPPAVVEGEGEAVGWTSGHETGISLGLVILFTVVRFYFTAVVMAHASVVVTRAAERESGKEGLDYSVVQVESPFKQTNSLGQGWQGKMGRGLISIGTGYWLSGESGPSSGGGRYARISSLAEA